MVAKRWIVERTCAWPRRCRRLARDLARHVRSLVAFIRLAMIRIMLRRLTETRSIQIQTFRIGSYVFGQFAVRRCRSSTSCSLRVLGRKLSVIEALAGC